MNGYSPYKFISHPESYGILPQPTSINPFSDARRVSSFDLSHIQPYHYVPPLPGEIILSDMRQQLSFVKNDIQQLIRSQQQTQNLLMMQKLQIINHQLRRQVGYMKHVQQRLRLQNHELQLKSDLNINVTGVKSSSRNINKIDDKSRSKSQYGYGNTLKQVIKQPKVQQKTNSTSDKELQQYKRKLQQQITLGNQRSNKLQAQIDQLKQNGGQYQKQMTKQIDRLTQQNSKLRQQVINYDVQFGSKEKNHDELKIKYNKTIAQLTTTQSKLNSQYQQILTLQQQVKQLSKEIQIKNKSSNQSSFNQVQQNNKKMQILKTEYQNYQNRFKQQTTRLSRDNTYLKQDLQKQKSKNVETLQKLQYTKNRIDQLVQQITMKDGKIAQLSGSLNQYKQFSSGQSDKIKQQLLVSKSKISQLQLKLIKNNQHQKNTQITIQQLKKQLSCKNTYIDQLNITYEQFKKEHKKLQDNTIQTKDQLKILLNQNQRLNQQVFDLNNQIQDQAQVHIQQKQINNQEEIKALEQHYKSIILQLQHSIIQLTKQNNNYSNKMLQIEENSKNRTSYILNLEKEYALSEAKQKQYQSKINSLQNTLSEKKITIQKLQQQCLRYKTITSGQNSQNITMQEILKRNTYGDTEIMNSLRAKSEQIIYLKSLIEDYKRKIDFLKNEADIDKLKIATVQKNQKNHYQIDIQNMKSQIQSNKRKMETLSTKLEGKITQLKKKDEFMQNIIMNKFGKDVQQSDIDYLKENTDKYFGKTYLDKILQTEEEVERLKQIIQRSQNQK